MNVVNHSKIYQCKAKKLSKINDRKTCKLYKTTFVTEQRNAFSGIFFYHGTTWVIILFASLSWLLVTLLFPG